MIRISKYFFCSIIFLSIALLSCTRAIPRHGVMIFSNQGDSDKPVTQIVLYTDSFTKGDVFFCDTFKISTKLFGEISQELYDCNLSVPADSCRYYCYKIFINTGQSEKIISIANHKDLHNLFSKLKLVIQTSNVHQNIVDEFEYVEKRMQPYNFRQESL